MTVNDAIGLLRDLRDSGYGAREVGCFLNCKHGSTYHYDKMNGFFVNLDNEYSFYVWHDKNDSSPPNATETDHD